MSNKGNHNDGDYSFIAEEWVDVIEMAVKFEENFNKLHDPDHPIKLDICIDSCIISPIKPGFLNVKRREWIEVH